MKRPTGKWAQANPKPAPSSGSGSWVLRLRWACMFRGGGRLGFLRELPLQLFDAANQLGQLLQGDHLPLRLAVGLRRGPKPGLAVRYVVHHAGLGRYRDPVAEFQVAGQANLPPQDHVVAQLGAARNANLRNDDAML